MCARVCVLGEFKEHLNPKISSYSTKFYEMLFFILIVRQNPNYLVPKAFWKWALMDPIDCSKWSQFWKRILRMRQIWHDTAVDHMVDLLSKLGSFRAISWDPLKPTSKTDLLLRHIWILCSNFKHFKHFSLRCKSTKSMKLFYI